MMRLVKNGLMFGNLIEVISPALVARYNRALKHLIGKQTQLTEFHIDICGYSPEIGDEFGDNQYLNPNGCNQQFILLTIDQKTAPLLRTQFSTSRSILRDYIDDNEDELFALTAREAVTGELMNSVFEVSSLKDLFQINHIEVEADTIGAHVADAKILQDHMDIFMSKEDAWWDDVLIAKMIELAKRAGNIIRNPVKLATKTYAQGNYYTSHFGGIYIFRDVKNPTIIARDPKIDLTDAPVKNILTFEDRAGIEKFLDEENLAERIVSVQNHDIASIIKQKIDFIAISTAANSGDKLGDFSRQEMRQIERKYADKMPSAYKGLMKVWRWASMGGNFPKLEPEHEAFFYMLRACQHHDRDLVNMLLSELSPLDFRQLFICHKDAFYTAYSSWPEAKKDFVSAFLVEEYAIDKAGVRETLFGAEPAMEEQEMSFKVYEHGPPITVRWKT